MKITSKAEFLALSSRGLLGNYLRHWDSSKALFDAGFPLPQWVTVRSRKRQSREFIPALRVEQAWAINRLGPDVFIQEIPAPETPRTANLEAMLTDRGLYLHIERDTTGPVRGIRERVAPLEGLRAVVQLRSALSPQSLETLADIWERYPSAIIEATEFQRPCGAMNERLVVWEVRDY